MQLCMQYFSGEEFQEQIFPSRAGESFGDSSYSMVPAHFPHTNLCQSVKECASPSRCPGCSPPTRKLAEKVSLWALFPRDNKTVVRRLCEGKRGPKCMALDTRGWTQRQVFINRNIRSHTKLYWEKLKLRRWEDTVNAHNLEGRRNTEQRDTLT